jgi:ATP-dependent helicase/nuclease subunit A
LSPSLHGGEAVLPGEALGEAPADALAHGAAVHRLLEHLHGCPPAERTALAARLLPGRADLAELLGEAERVLAAPELGAIFGPDGLAEVDVAAPVPGRDDLRIAGRIDRLVPPSGCRKRSCASSAHIARRWCRSGRIGRWRWRCSGPAPPG